MTFFALKYQVGTKKACYSFRMDSDNISLNLVDVITNVGFITPL